ncbi:hypothetical protein MNBD_GAMMA07-826 [hydrothermal vent metagenome]|uniref:Transcriptional regulator, LysR family n=1 Tax=hydrothermal vent metagenome TaxID=652676 RepID=A0A3B0XIT0_9ZZZZ
MANFLKSGQVKIVLEDYVPIPLAIHAVFPDRRYIPAKARCFVEYLSQQLD